MPVNKPIKDLTRHLFLCREKVKSTAQLVTSNRFKMQENMTNGSSDQGGRTQVLESHAQQHINPEGPLPAAATGHGISPAGNDSKEPHTDDDREDRGLRRIIRNFTPSYTLPVSFVFPQGSLLTPCARRTDGSSLL